MNYGGYGGGYNQPGPMTMPQARSYPPVSTAPNPYMPHNQQQPPPPNQIATYNHNVSSFEEVRTFIIDPGTFHIFFNNAANQIYTKHLIQDGSAALRVYGLLETPEVRPQQEDSSEKFTALQSQILEMQRQIQEQQSQASELRQQIVTLQTQLSPLFEGGKE